MILRTLLAAATVIGCLSLAAAVPLSRTQAVAAKQSAKPQRIMSTNMCSDLLLLMLVPRERIASITYLTHPAVRVLMPGADRGVAVNHGTAEEVVRQQPDLILASPWSTPVMRRLGAKVGAPVVEIDSAASFEDIRRVTRQIGALVGEPERAEALIARMDHSLNELEATRPTKPVRVVAWIGDGSVPGAGTLTDAIIRAAGADNVAVEYQDRRYSSFGLEELLVSRPDAILRGEDRYDGPALRDRVAGHPVVQRAFRGRQIGYPASLYACGLPQSVDAARQLRAALEKLPKGGVSW